MIYILDDALSWKKNGKMKERMGIPKIPRK